MFHDESTGNFLENKVKKINKEKIEFERIPVGQMNSRFEATSTGSHSSMASGNGFKMIF